VNRTVWLVPGREAKDRMVVEGVFRLLWSQPGNGFAGFWEYRVEGAVRRERYPETVRDGQEATAGLFLPSVITETGLDIGRYISSRLTRAQR
jgi:hypothetical protein